MADVDIKGLHKVFDRTEAVRGIDLSIKDNEFVILVGPSGCGKSTVLRMIAGLEEVTKGKIYIGENLVNDVPPKDRDIAMVFQSYALYPHMTVFENMSFGLRLRKFSKEDIKKRVEEAGKVLGISELLERRPRQLSGGQRQRVAMGRAIVRNPKVFLFDEPLSNLDAKMRGQMRIEIKRVHQHLKTTTIYVTHDQVEAMTLGDRLMVLNDGVVEQFGTPIELYDRPETIFVAGFIGSPSMNFIPATCQKDFIILCNGTKVSKFKGDHTRVTLGIRPEHLQIDTKGNVQVIVQMVEQLGANSLIHGLLKETDVEIVVSIPGHVTAEVGSVMAFNIKKDSTHIFHTDTGKRIA